MEAFLVLLGIYLFAVLIVLPIWTIIKVTSQRRDQEILQQQLTALQQELQALRAGAKQPSSPVTPSQPFTAATVVPPPATVVPPPSAVAPVVPAVAAPLPVTTAPVAAPLPTPPAPSAEPP